jgi:hypothetical protein
MHSKRRRSIRAAAHFAALVPLAVGAAPPGPGTGASAAAASSWRSDPVWDDGNAEFCAYEVTWARYGHLYAGRALLVLVKEPWAPDLDVKADRPRPGGFDVLKLNHVRDVPTGIYTYHQMASVYLRRDDGTVRKLAATSSEACGISSADMTRGTLRTRSYFDRQGDRAMRWPQGALPEDGLPALLRDCVAAECPRALEVFPSLLMGRFGSLEPTTYGVRKQDLGTVRVPAGEFHGVEIRLQSGSDSISYVFDSRPPHRLLRFHRADGTEYRLAKADRIRYWTMHDPGGEAWLPENVR